MDIDIATDGGAYSTLSSTVLSRATLHSPGPYVCPNVRIRSHAWATNTVPYGAFRGFGAPQTIFAVERHMDEIAAAIGIDPDRTATPQLHSPRRNHRNRTVDARARNPRQAARPRAGRKRLLQQARPIRGRKSAQRHQARHGHRRFLSRLRLHGLRRTLSQFARGHRRHRRRQSACSRFKHGVWPGH